MTKEKRTNITEKVVTPFGTIAQMSADLNVSRDAISDALNGYTRTSLAKLLRVVAKKFYNGQSLNQ